MALERKAGSNWWYLRYRDGNKVRQVKLKVRVRGILPTGPDDDGDKVFRESKAEAQVEHNKVLAEIRGQDPGAEKAIQQIVALKTGAKIEFPKLEDLYDHWKRIPRRKKPTARYAKQCQGALKNFVDWVHEEKPHLVHFVQVTPAMAQAYLEYREKQGVSTKTWNDTLKLLRATFKHLHPQLPEGQNPFHRFVTRTLETVNRHPFTPEEMNRILDACAEDDFIRPVIVTGMCTAMRRGDCCLLRWEDVDLKSGFITVKTSKTGETVDIPILGLFRGELERAAAESGGREPPTEGYVFPEQAAMYETNSDGITLRVQRVLTAALGGPVKAQEKELPQLPAGDARPKGEAYIAGLENREKADRMKIVFDAYMDGQSVRDVTKNTGISKASVSMYLSEIEVALGCKLVRGRQAKGASFAARMKADTSVLHEKREKGARRASVRDFHSFRVTWITIALAAGVPLEIVQRVTGHKTVDVVLKHYFRPGREDFRRTLENAMPQLFLVSGQKALPGAGETQEAIGPSDALEKALLGLDAMTAQTWKGQRDIVVTLVKQAKEWVDRRTVLDVTEEPEAARA